MAIKCGFFNSVNGDRTYTAEDLGRYLHGIVSDGVYPDASDSLQVLASGGNMDVLVQPGRAMLKYHYLENDSPYTFTIDAGGAIPRTDAVVAYVDLELRECGLAVKKGGGPSGGGNMPPAIIRGDVRREYVLAYVHVPALATRITQANITDTRADDYCGWVTGVIQQVDTTTLFNQYEAAYAEKMAELNGYLTEAKAAADKKVEDIGYIPQRGVDFWTETDKAEIVDNVLDSLQVWTGGTY